MAFRPSNSDFGYDSGIISKKLEVDMINICKFFNFRVYSKDVT
jgi:hypothetical protein